MPHDREITERAKLLIGTGRYGENEARIEATKQIARERDRKNWANNTKPSPTDVILPTT